MNVHIDGPLSAPAGLGELAGLYRELHATHLAVSRYGPLVADPARSWQLRRLLYEKALEHGDAVYFVARTDHGSVVGYAFAVTSAGPDDTFDTTGIVELVSLTVTATQRGQGLGKRLIAAIETYATQQGADTIKVAVIEGNDRADALYTRLGYTPGERLLYKHIGDASP